MVVQSGMAEEKPSAELPISSSQPPSSLTDQPPKQEPEYPPMSRIWIGMLAIYVTMFITSLVRQPPLSLSSLPLLISHPTQTSHIC